MLFDEVTLAIDPESIGRVLAQGGMTTIVVTHKIGFARQVGSRLVCLKDGQIVEQGPCSQVLSNPQEARTKQFLAAILQH